MSITPEQARAMSTPEIVRALRGTTECDPDCSCRGSTAPQTDGGEPEVITPRRLVR